MKYVINLPERLDRRKEMEAQLHRIGWRAEFLAATKPTTADGFPSVGARGCFLSHLEALKRGAGLNEHIVLMEDDLDFVPDFEKLWQQAYEATLTREWAIFYPGHTLGDKASGLSMIDPSEGIVCTHFVMIHRDAAQTIIQGLETMLSRPPGHPLGGPMHVDGAYSTIRAQNPQLKTYVFSPSLGHQRSSRSDIANLRFYDRIEMLRPIVIRLRRVKSALK
ncbi:glycosyltransferase family 25 protein [Bradyrhizobium sp. dw_78]|uniref:glycosyltransferase family 25 protein n=1 Tax=Bradyrhizobium sp. dw_78 TaxID=2719793 RepID=UPI001BD242B3|nr:glycosyltransferase family 25 protein [Bradyrhizobium sp. dw_78]